MTVAYSAKLFKSVDHIHRKKKETWKEGKQCVPICENNTNKWNKRVNKLHISTTKTFRDSHFRMCPKTVTLIVSHIRFTFININTNTQQINVDVMNPMLEPNWREINNTDIHSIGNFSRDIHAETACIFQVPSRENPARNFGRFGNIISCYYEYPSISVQFFPNNIEPICTQIVFLSVNLLYIHKLLSPLWKTIE